MSALKEKAQRAAAESWGEVTPAEVAAHATTPPPAQQETPVPLVPIAELTAPTSDDPPPVTVFVAWARVMRDVEAVGKHGLYNAAGTRYNFRGVDAMINAFGPACRRHGVIVMPTAVHAEHGDAVTSKGNATRESIVVVSWRIYGPLGDHMDGASAGESLDSSDKGTAKAQSVALRAFLIAAGLVPTDEKDPDASHIERGERPRVAPGRYVEEVADPRTSLGRLRQIRSEINQHGIGNALVTNENGDEEPLMAMVVRIGKARAEGGE
jgi:hypothetical protein